MPVNYKPYLWVQVATPPSANHKLYFYIQLPLGIGLDSGKESQEDDRIVVTFVAKTGLTGPGSPVSYTLTSYNPSTCHKITVKIVDAVGTIKGISTVEPIASYFSGSEYNYVPHIWLKFITTSTSVLYFTTKIPAGKKILTTPTVSDVLSDNSRTLKYKVVSDSTVMLESLQELTFALDATTGYDPIYEYIIVKISDDATPANELGDGTSQDSEADASGDGFVV